MEDYSKIRISGDWVGLIGMKGAINDAKGKSLAAEALKDFLFGKIKEKNYITPGMESSYREALYREYCKASGLPYEEDAEKGLSIQILGPGCNQCDRLEQEVLAVLVELGTRADVQHVRNLNEIARFGVTGVPALVINDQVRSIRRVPTRRQIREWIEGT